MFVATSISTITSLAASKKSHIFSSICCLLTSSARALATTSTNRPFFTPVPYEAPSWSRNVLRSAPRHGRLHLANLPTPLYRIDYWSNDDDAVSLARRMVQSLDLKLYVKRDDATGAVELGGNKIRKLEFPLAECLMEGFDSVVTIGGEQSNHCRATAAAARMVGLQPHLILRSPRANKDDDLGLTGNLLSGRVACAGAPALRSFGATRSPTVRHSSGRQQWSWKLGLHQWCGRTAGAVEESGRSAVARSYCFCLWVWWNSGWYCSRHCFSAHVGWSKGSHGARHRSVRR